MALAYLICKYIFQDNLGYLLRQKSNVNDNNKSWETCSKFKRKKKEKQDKTKLKDVIIQIRCKGLESTMFIAWAKWSCCLNISEALFSRCRES